MTVVLITGCSSGIGLAAAVEFARQGCDVVATMRNLDRSGPLRECARRGRAWRPTSVCSTSPTTSRCATASPAVVADHGGIDVVVSNAGIGIDGSTEELTIDDFRASFETNVLGTRAAAARRAARHGVSAGAAASSP